MSALAQTEEAQRASLFFGNKKNKGTKPRRRINGKTASNNIVCQENEDQGHEELDEGPRDEQIC